MRAIALLLLVVWPIGCTGQIGPTDTSAPTPRDRTPAASSDQAGCALFRQTDLAASLGAAVDLVPEQSSQTVCTWDVLDSAGAYRVTVRLEDGFEDLQAAQSAFPVGTEVAGVGGSAYWSPGVMTLWFQHEGRLYAVQFFGVPEAVDALDHAIVIAQLVTTFAG